MVERHAPESEIGARNECCEGQIEADSWSQGTDWYAVNETLMRCYRYGAPSVPVESPSASVAC